MLYPSQLVRRPHVGKLYFWRGKNSDFDFFPGKLNFEILGKPALVTNLIKRAQRSNDGKHLLSLHCDGKSFAKMQFALTHICTSYQAKRRHRSTKYSMA